ncbi:MAG: methyltransferase [Gemmatimonadales bacterium]|jgi:(2Fe-2S) ferredoxin/SAM-dependent methyltransferase
MQPFTYHVLACDQKKPDGAPCCSARGSAAVIEALRREIGAAGLGDTVQLTTTGSLGLCDRGPNLVVYPDGTWYSGVTPADVPEIVRQHFGEGRPVTRLANGDAASVKTEILAGRAKHLAALKARDTAGVVPDELMGAIRGYQESRIMLTAIELDVFTAVGGGATAETVAKRCGTDRRATELLLNALVALDVMRLAGDGYENTPLAGRFLVAGSPDDARIALRHNLSLWTTWSSLTEAVRVGHTALRAEMRERGDDWTVPFIAAMHRGAAVRAPLVVEAIGASPIRRMLDVGGGSGAYAIAFAQANPNLTAVVLDLPTVLPIAEGHIGDAGLATRITTRAGDLRRDDLGRDFDLVFLSSICHMLGPDGNRDLLARAARALAPGGRVVVQDFILEPDRTGPRQAVLFAINMLVGTEAGGTYTEDEYASWLRTAGLTDVRRIRLKGPADLIVGVRR